MIQLFRLAIYVEYVVYVIPVFGYEASLRKIKRVI